MALFVKDTPTSGKIDPKLALAMIDDLREAIELIDMEGRMTPATFKNFCKVTGHFWTIRSSLVNNIQQSVGW